MAAFFEQSLMLYRPPRSSPKCFMSLDTICVRISDLRQLGFADPVKMITSFPAIARLARDNVRRKIADPRSRLLRPSEDDHFSLPPIFGLPIKNIRCRIDDLRTLFQLGAMRGHPWNAQSADVRAGEVDTAFSSASYGFALFFAAATMVRTSDHVPGWAASTASMSARGCLISHGNVWSVRPS